MLIFKLFLFLLFFIYGYIILVTYFTQKPNNNLIGTKKNDEFISIIVSARNEEDNLLVLFQSICKVKYPVDRFEIILMDDDSSDKTFMLMNEFKKQSNLSVKVIRLSDTDCKENHKKYAIQHAIKIAKGNIIALTDADCILPANWLININSAFNENNVKFIAGPVKIQPKSASMLLNLFEAFEWIVLQAITFTNLNSQKQIMCNGANMAFTKSAFQEVDGYDGDKSASGDDVFLMLKIKKKFGKLSVQSIYSSNPVITHTINNFRSFISQRIRWASKTKHIDDSDVFIFGIIILMTNLSMVLLPFISAFYPTLVNIYLLFFLFKLMVDSILIKVGSSILNSPIKWQFVPFFAFIYPYYLIFISFLALFIKPVWKGRIINV